MRLPLTLAWAVAASSQACVSPKPRCTSLPSSGTFSGDTFEPSDGCFLAVPSPDESRAILRGSWVVMCGGSNGWVTAQAIGNHLEPGVYLVIAAAHAFAHPPIPPPASRKTGTR